VQLDISCAEKKDFAHSLKETSVLAVLHFTNATAPSSTIKNV